LSTRKKKNNEGPNEKKSAFVFSSMIKNSLDKSGRIRNRENNRQKQWFFGNEIQSRHW